MSFVVWAVALASVIFVSLLSLIGVALLSLRESVQKRLVPLLVAFAIGALLGDAFIHLLPDAVHASGFTLSVSAWVLGGMFCFYVVEKIVLSTHHARHNSRHIRSFAITILFGDALHNAIDGMVIGASYIVSIPLGVATTFAIIAHEIPHELGDFAVLIHGGFSTGRAILYNFLTALPAIGGTVVILLFGLQPGAAATSVLPFTAGSFIYIAASDLLPEISEETNPGKSTLQLLAIACGVACMWALLALG